MKKMIVAALAVAFLAGSATATDLTLTGSPASMDVTFPATVEFDVVAELSDNLNEGLAAYGFDIRGELDGAPFDVTSATVTVPAGIEAFSVDGLTNPAGYGGTAINGVLVQIGAAQNTIANPGPNPPFPIGQVQFGVGANGSPQVVAHVSIDLTTAPTTDYTFYIENGFANVIRDGEVIAPQLVDAVGTVTGSTVVVTAGAGDPCPWDQDGDGFVTPFDSNAVMAQFGCNVGGGDPACDAADIDGDGVVNPFDSNAVLAQFGPCP